MDLITEIECDEAHFKRITSKTHKKHPKVKMLINLSSSVKLRSSDRIRLIYAYRFGLNNNIIDLNNLEIDGKIRRLRLKSSDLSTVTVPSKYRYQYHCWFKIDADLIPLNVVYLKDPLDPHTSGLIGNIFNYGFEIQRIDRSKIITNVFIHEVIGRLVQRSENYIIEVQPVGLALFL